MDAAGEEDVDVGRVGAAASASSSTSTIVLPEHEARARADVAAALAALEDEPAGAVREEQLAAARATGTCR